MEAFNYKAVSDRHRLYMYIGSQIDVCYHYHEFFELVYIVQGITLHGYKGMEQILKSGDYFLIDLFTPHAYKNLDSNKISVAECFFFPEFLENECSNIKSFRNLMGKYPLGINYHNLTDEPTNHIFHDDENKTVYNKLIDMNHEITNCAQGSDKLLKYKLSELLILMLRQISCLDKKETSECIEYIKTYISKNFSEDLTLSFFCEKQNYSLSHLCRKFKDEVGMSYSDYLQRVRIGKSCEFMLLTDKKLEEISRLVGYSDIKFFKSVFKKIVGTSPQEFKKLNRKNS